jgi:hypothetical protein
MPQIPCPDKIDCACDDSPFANLSSEAPDLPVFLGRSFTRLQPPLGTVWDGLDCPGVCQSTVSQEAADLCAEELAFACVVRGWTLPGGTALAPAPPAQGAGGGPRYPVFFNTEQTCGVRCADGLVFLFTVPAFVFAGTSQARADAQARSYACRQAQLRKVCLSSLTSPVCAGVEFNQTITASGKFLATGSQTNAWVLEAGTLPPGLTFHGGNLQSNSATLTGTPTTPGTYFFIISVTDPKGNTMAKGYSLVIGGITNAGALPDARKNAAYSHQLTAVGFTVPLFSVIGVLPDGLSMDESGLITGTPTTQGTASFTLQVEEAA